MEVVYAKRSIVYALLFLVLPVLALQLPGRVAPPPVVTQAVRPTLRPIVTQPLPSSRKPWTLDSARAALECEPDDPFVQYVVLQLARQEGKLADVIKTAPFGRLNRP